MSKVSIQQEALAGDEPRHEGAARAVDLDRRRSQRTELTVRVDYSTVDELFSEFTRDVNEGGLFIETERPRPQGTLVALHFNLPGSERPIETLGRVVHVSRGEGDAPPGMGIEFEGLGEDARERINALIRALRTGAVPTS